jgi:hypothetical protein
MVGDNGGGRGDTAGAQEGISGRRTGDGLLGGQAGGGLRCGRGRQWLTRWTAGSAAGERMGVRRQTAIRTSRLRKEAQEF